MVRSTITTAKCIMVIQEPTLQSNASNDSTTYNTKITTIYMDASAIPVRDAVSGVR